jgi:hypothetical protein
MSLYVSVCLCLSLSVSVCLSMSLSVLVCLCLSLTQFSGYQYQIGAFAKGKLHQLYRIVIYFIQAMLQDLNLQLILLFNVFGISKIVFYVEINPN